MPDSLVERIDTAPILRIGLSRPNSNRCCYGGISETSIGAPPAVKAPTPMDLLQLEHFLAVVEEGSFTRAAERMSRTQPAISQSVKKLEDEIGAPLFARDVHDLSLTEAGKILVEYARKMVRARDDSMRDLGALKSLKTGTLTIAAHESAAVYLLPAPLRQYLGPLSRRQGRHLSQFADGDPAASHGPRGPRRLRERRA